MQAGIKFTYNGETGQVDSIGLADMVAFEKHFGISAAALQPPPKLNPDGSVMLDANGEPVLDDTAVRLEWVAFMVYRAARKLGMISKETPFDEDFLEGVGEVEIGDVASAASDEEGEGADPFRMPSPSPA